MIDMEANLKELCARIITDLDNCTNQDKKDAYTYLDLKIKATPEGADIKGYLDSSVISRDSCVLLNGQTSGYQLFWIKSYSKVISASASFSSIHGNIGQVKIE